MPRLNIRDDVYAAMHAALTTNGGYLYCGRDRQTGPQTGRGTLLMLAKRGWVQLVYTKPIGTRQKRRHVAGAWILSPGRVAMRDEVLRRGGTMPPRLALPTPPSTPPAPVLTLPQIRLPRPAVNAPWFTGTTPRVPTFPLPRRSLTEQVDAFALIGTGSPTDDDIPF